MHWLLGEGCAGAHSKLVKYLCTGSSVREWIHSAQRVMCVRTGGPCLPQDLTMSLMMSFMPLTVSTMTRGIMLMYHGTDEMAGTHCKQADTQAHTYKTQRQHRQ